MLAQSTGWEAAIRWWDAVELWLTQLWLPVQFALLVLVLLPLCWWAARVIDHGVELAFERLGHRSAGAASDTDDDARVEPGGGPG